MKENLQITNDIKKYFNSHSKTFILSEILIKKHKLKAVEAYVYFSKFEVKYGKRKS